MNWPIIIGVSFIVFIAAIPSLIYIRNMYKDNAYKNMSSVDKLVLYKELEMIRELQRDTNDKQSKN